MKKCICKKCEDCRLFFTWDMENNDGLRKQVQKCVFNVFADEIPKMRREINGVQSGVEQARNRSAESLQTVKEYTEKAQATLNGVKKILMIGMKEDERSI